MNVMKLFAGCMAAAMIFMTSGCSLKQTADSTNTSQQTTQITDSTTVEDTTVESTTAADEYNFTIVRHWSEDERRRAYTSRQHVQSNDSDPYDVTQINMDYLSMFPEILTDGHPVYADHMELNGNRPMFSIDFLDSLTDDNTTYEYYSDLDDMGRCGTAYAVICNDIMPTEKRGAIGSVKPSGWQTAKYDKSIISDMYLYNRCHLIGYQLAGENANPNNLITGTRFMNIVGMLPFENMIDNYIEANPDNHVLMQVTPIFGENNLVAYGVVMSAVSCEDRGAGVSYCVFCPNVQPQIIIDYTNGDNNASGDNWYNGDIPSFIHEDAEYESEDSAADTETATVSSDTTYVVNENTKKFHLPGCEYANKISDDNRRDTNETFDELIGNGYDPCRNCLG